MITIQTDDGPIEITDSILKNYAKLMSMLDVDLSVKCVYGELTIADFIIEGMDKATELNNRNKVGCTVYALACIYYTVRTAQNFEVL